MHRSFRGPRRALAIALSVTLGLAPALAQGVGLAVGIEYALIENPAHVRGQAQVFGELGIPAVKHYAESAQWGEMQARPGAPLDFRRLDTFVREYQAAGFRVLTLCLRSHSPWASRKPGVTAKMLGLTDPTPRPEHRAAYASWVQAVVERYDHDGVADMPGLAAPATYLEIGSELSSYEPEPVSAYLDMLQLAYRAARRASDGIRVAHAAFLPTPADLSGARTLAEMEQAFTATTRHDTTHDLSSMRAVLDRPDLFDVINLHPLGDPYELEHLMRWLGMEMQQRNYKKPVIASDTIHTSYIAWGAATVCTGPKKGLGVLIPPAREADRCRLAKHFQALVGKDPAALAWTRGFLAADHVKRTLVAAEQGLALINLSFTCDLPFLTLPLARAGAGLSAWGGMVDLGWTGGVKGRFPNFHAIRQLGHHGVGAAPVRRRAHADPRVRVYAWQQNGRTLLAAWLEPGGVQLPDRPEPRASVVLPVDRPQVTVEPVVTLIGQAEPERRAVPAPGGRLTIELTTVPVFVY